MACEFSPRISFMHALAHIFCFCLTVLYSISSFTHQRHKTPCCQNTEFHLFLLFFILFYFKKLIYLAASGLSCSMRGLLLRCLGSLVVACRLQSAWAQQLWHAGLVAPWHVGSQFEPTSPALEGRFLTTGPPGKSHHLFLLNSCFSKYILFHCMNKP